MEDPDQCDKYYTCETTGKLTPKLCEVGGGQGGWPGWVVATGHWPGWVARAGGQGGWSPGGHPVVPTPSIMVLTPSTRTVWCTTSPASPATTHRGQLPYLPSIAREALPALTAINALVALAAIFAKAAIDAPSVCRARPGKPRP